MVDRERKVLMTDMTNGRSGNGVVFIGGEDGEGVELECW